LTLGDGIRYNIVTLPPEEQRIFRDAFVKLHKKYFFPDGVSGWFKQDQIHQKTHVHAGAGFLPWHRELCNRFEELLRDPEVEPGISLHYWDFAQNPEEVNLLGPNGLFGASHGRVAPPLNVLHNNGVEAGSRREPSNPNAPPADPTLPPQDIVRDLDPVFPFTSTDERIIKSGDTFDGKPVAQENQWPRFRLALERAHNSAHDYIGGNIENSHFAFEDPFIFLLHSNVDRLWASWQLQPGKEWRIKPNEIYGIESEAERITEFMEPWAGGTVHLEQKMRPWGVDWAAEKKNAKDDSIATQIPKYDKYTNLP
jgi:hypothetical protein